MQERHTNRQQYFNELAHTCERFFIPYIRQYKAIGPSTRILEIGCGDGGNLLPFARMGCQVMGVDIAECRITDAKAFFEQEGAKGTFIASDVFLLTELHHSFDIIICHDVIEHIGDKYGFISKLSAFMAEDGIIFMSFPAWQMPFGGHQQICRSKLLSHAPYLHLLPRGMYKAVLNCGKESESCVRELLDIKSTKCPIETFERVIKDTTDLYISQRTLYFINPHYETKFGMKPRKLWDFVGAIPYLRNFVTSSCFYILQNKGIRPLLT